MEISELATMESYANRAWGSYYPNRYYFSIEVHKTREQAGLTGSKQELTPDEQRQLQWENYPAMLHEFLHYMHDVSTMVGQACLFNQIMMQSIFTKYASPGMESAASLGMKKEPSLDQHFYHAAMFSKALEGGVALVTKMHQITGIDPVSETIKGMNGTELVSRDIIIPHIHYAEKNISGDIAATVKLGSFYLFEGIAYEMDKLVSKRQNHPEADNKSRLASEYTVARMVAQYLFPQIEIKTMVCLALMSLQFMDCGDTFIHLVQEVRDNEQKAISQEQSLVQIKQRIRAHLKQYETAFASQLANYKTIFTGRTRLFKSFSYLADVSLSLYKERIKDPCFEINLIYNDHISDLLDKVQLCDFYMFLTILILCPLIPNSTATISAPP